MFCTLGVGSIVSGHSAPAPNPCHPIAPNCLAKSEFVFTYNYCTVRSFGATLTGFGGAVGRCGRRMKVSRAISIWKNFAKQVSIDYLLRILVLANCESDRKHGLLSSNIVGGRCASRAVRTKPD
jgi:hypothetical protein